MIEIVEVIILCNILISFNKMIIDSDHLSSFFLYLLILKLRIYCTVSWLQSMLTEYCWDLHGWQDVVEKTSLDLWFLLPPLHLLHQWFVPSWPCICWSFLQLMTYLKLILYLIHQVLISNQTGQMDQVVVYISVGILQFRSCFSIAFLFSFSLFHLIQYFYKK